MNLRIGSGDVYKILSGINTNTYQDFLRQFVSDEKPYYNAKESPIDALRTGAILEERYALILPDNYYCQWKEESKEMDVLSCSIDFAEINEGKVVDFDELKTINLSDYLVYIEPVKGKSEADYLPVIKKYFKKYYEQVQQQLYCSELESGNLVFLAVYTYEDGVNYNRDIAENEYTKFRIKRDEKVIEKIKSSALFFQQIKDHFK